MTVAGLPCKLCPKLCGRNEETKPFSQVRDEPWVGIEHSRAMVIPLALVYMAKGGYAGAG
jgi:hypothetical protein